ncbi:MAG: glycosyltransferase family A protein [Candidatus Nomurabacteria bacterium]|nr:glycosyltransferase family A protein [Candidatus Nomurabacteria bacterium]
MKISLVIPAYNEEKYIGICLESVFKNAPDFFHEIIVIDNASTDKTKEVVEKFQGVKVIHESQKGLTSARQKGLESASGDLIAYIDADTKMPKGWRDKVIKAFFENQNFVCVSGPYIYHDVSFLKSISVWIYWHLFAYPTYLLTGYMTVGGNFVAKKSALEKINGFDKSISFYGEDTDIAKRLHKVGKVKFMPSLFMYTSARRFTGQGTLKTAFIYMLNFLSVAIKGKPISKEYKDIR